MCVTTNMHYKLQVEKEKLHISTIVLLSRDTIGYFMMSLKSMSS